MLKNIIPLSAFLIPTTVLAMSWSADTPFIDVKKTSPEAVSVHVLTEEGIIAKSTNNRFYTNRLITRADFLKMAVASALNVTSQDPIDKTTPSEKCFIDVPEKNPLAPYACSAKKNGIITGSRFYPSRPIQYDEALKILTLLYQYKIDVSTTKKDWATQYYNAAKEKGVDLSQRIRFDTRLTRGMAARLVAAFFAESKGELTNLRLAESGNFDLISVPQSSSPSSASSESSASSTSSVSSISSTSSLSDLRHHFLSLGTLSKPLVTLTVPARTEKQSVALAKVVLANEVRSIASFQVVQEDGTVVATLVQRTTTDLPEYKKIYEGQISTQNQIFLPANSAQKLILRANVRSAIEGGISDELLSIQSFSATLRTESNETINIVGEPPFFKHQTTFGMNPSLEKISLSSQNIVAGTGKILYQLKATVPDVPAREFALRQIQWNISMNNLTISSPQITRGQITIPCSLNTNEMTITCAFNTSTAGLLSSSNDTAFSLQADVSLESGKSVGSIILSLPRTGSPSERGNIEWTDGSGKFQWIEKDAPLLPSEMITITK